ncbi:MAG TPA: 30S ribosomal protein S20 [Candidatus Woesebacteria bacterium]|jgi:ribosomal protein S20|nr:30S ribosomal protein S20 [Candidatus Woesebacteria bacterium]HNQ16534.1 30S ribosomal protein S20 [Candidatus Woesebacteria bacterium]HNS65295.1 30S ribosomal protein S20 [Candidatus Woesebacteria bacterium]
MPILKNAQKALRVSQRKAAYNAVVRSRMRSVLKQLKTTPTKELLDLSYSRIDRALKRNLLHINKAARLKAQASKLLKAA